VIFISISANDAMRRTKHQPVRSDWQPAPEKLIGVSAAEAHLWRVPIDVEPSYVDCLHGLLSHDERERAARYRFERDRRRFIAARGVLRILTGRYLSTAPHKLSFEYGPNGKPFLSGFKTDLHFNVAHSHGLALIGFTLGHRIGVDVENVDRSLDVESIASRFFSAQEVSALMALPPEQRRKAFFACWTRKEAYIKARGEGLSFGLKDFSVSVAPSDPPALLNVRQEPGETARWRYLPIDAGSSYAAAAAVEGEVSPRTRYWQFRHENFKQ
jgi:4'-phosphopantetheinyl transferase